VERELCPGVGLEFMCVVFPWYSELREHVEP